jgi:hypothetical protein
MHTTVACCRCKRAQKTLTRMHHAKSSDSWAADLPLLKAVLARGVAVTSAAAAAAVQVRSLVGCGRCSLLMVKWNGRCRLGLAG